MVVDNWIPLVNKYETECKTCDERIGVGEKVLWQKGNGVRHEKCEPVEMKIVDEKKTVDEKDWKDYKQYSYKELQLIQDCQCCGISLSFLKDVFINDDRRTCQECFTI